MTSICLKDGILTLVQRGDGLLALSVSRPTGDVTTIVVPPTIKGLKKALEEVEKAHESLWG